MRPTSNSFLTAKIKFITRPFTGLSHLREHKFKDTHREKAPSNKTSTPSKSMNMDIQMVGTSNQLFI